MRLRNWMSRRRERERDLNEEVESHLRMAAQERTEQGETAEQARAAALRDFGNVILVKEVTRDMWGWSWLESLLGDVRHGLRVLWKNPGFTIVAVITLALGIGANTAIFTLVDAVMLRTLPVANAGQLYRLGDNNNCCVMSGTQNDGSFVLYSYPLYQDLRDHTGEFSNLAAFTPFLTGLSIRRSHVSSPAKPGRGELVSGNYFAALGVHPIAGRTFVATDDQPGALPTAVMNYHTWHQEFGDDPSVIGATFTINTVPYTVVGVAPPGFYGETLRSDPPDFWLPLSTEPLLNRQNSRLDRAALEWLYLLGRLKAGADPAKVQAQLTVELQQWLHSRPEVIPERDRGAMSRQHIRLTPAAHGVDQMQTDYAVGLRLLMTLSGLVLLITCANIANLLLARGVGNRSQTALRMALGAPRSRLIRQMLTESVLLALAGGAAGMAVAFAGTHALLLLAFRGAHYVPITARPSLPVLGFAMLLSLATGLVFGVAPAWMASHSDPADALRGAGRSTSDRSSLAQRSLVILQVALSVVLLIGAGLLTRSLRNLEDQHFGFVTEGRLIVRVDPAHAGYTPDGLSPLYQKLQQQLSQLPGVRSVSLSGYSPLGDDNWNERVFVEGHRPDFQGVAPSWDRVGPHYFEAIGTRLLRGRTIEERDTPAAPHIAVINETFARRFFPSEDPIGQHFGMDDASHSGDYEVVGIVEDAKYQDARGPAYATFFLPLLQTPPGDLSHDFSVYVGDIEVLVAGKPESFQPAVRQTIAGIDPNLTVLGMMSFGEQVDLAFNQDRLVARLTELFGVLALTLACVGLYGVTAFAVARRTNEIGIRMALGANRSSVLAMVLRGASTQVLIGLAFGIPAALAGSRLLSSVLYGVKSYDPLTVFLAAVLLSACALFAGLIPARRAAKVDPMVALRYE